MDIHEDAKSNRVTATFELPGLNKGDVNIDLHNNRLTIAGETKTSSDREENGYALRERSYGAFSRTLQVPAGIKVSLLPFSSTQSSDVVPSQPEEVKASMENGVLAVTFPKVTSEQAPKKITVA